MVDALRRWAPLAAVTAVAVAVLDALRVPSSALVAALVVGIGFALSGRSPGVVSRWAMTGAQAVLGVVIGALVQSSTLSAVARV